MGLVSGIRAELNGGGIQNLVSQVTYGCQECHKALQSLEKLLQHYRGNPRAPRPPELLQAVLAFGTTEQGFPPGLENDTL